jgi:outer membrane murein-binding lipoprotein Lpp
VSASDFRKFLTKSILAASAIGFCSALLCAQDAPKAGAPDSAQASQNEVRALADAVRSLQSQVQALTSQMNEMRSQQQQALEESRQLRRQLAAKSGEPNATATAQNSSGYSDVPSSAPANASSAEAAAPNPVESGQQVSGDGASKLEEDVQLIDAKVNDQYQTKVESGSKYRLRLSGIVLLNLFSNRGNVDNADFPGLAQPAQLTESNSSLGGSLRQSQLTLSGFGPDIAGAHTSANVSFDFAGGFADTQNGDPMGVARLRTGTIRFDWTDTSVIVGQDALFLSPNAPTSLATLAVPALSYSGNLWSWAPQIRVEHQIHLSDASALHFQFGLLDSLSGDVPSGNTDREPTWGEQSGQPAYAARVSWSYRLFGRDMVAGFGGYYGRQSWAFGRTVDSWAGTTDLTVPFGKYFDFSSEFYRGTSLGGLGGGVDQSVLLSGSFIDPNTSVKGLKSMGGWTQLKFKPKPKFEVNGAFGQDNPFASQINLFPSAFNTSNYENSPFIERNRSAFVNFIYQPRSDVIFGLEYRRLRTFYLEAPSQTANQVNMSVGYIF